MIKFITIITFIIMITVNALANIIPINGVNTGEISDYYSNLFAPAGYTFAIWGVIYILLGAYTFYQAAFYWSEYAIFKTGLFKKIGTYFSISSVANSMWIFAWHYKMIPLTVLLMLVILICMIAISLEMKKTKFLDQEKLFIKIPFSIYFGWITVATIANITVLLVYLNWMGHGVTEPIWTSIIIILGLIIGILTIFKNKDFIYGIPIIWAYVGILVKHLSVSGFGGKYPMVIFTVAFAIFALVVSEFMVIKKRC